MAVIFINNVEVFRSTGSDCDVVSAAIAAKAIEFDDDITVVSESGCFSDSATEWMAEFGGIFTDFLPA